MAPGAANVRLTDVTGDSGGSVRFDSMMWVPRYDSMAPVSWIKEIKPMDGGAFYVEWGGIDDVSGIMSFDVQYRNVNGGDWVDWQLGTWANAALFSPPSSGTFEFRVRARDWMNKEGGWDQDPATMKSVVVP
jgi:hypothetical protein